MTAPAPFVVGLARSGTTLLRLMLDAHPDLAVPPETHFIPRALRATPGVPATARAFCDALVANERWGDFGLDQAVLRRRVEALAPFDRGEGLRSFYRLYAERFGKPRWGDKTPPYLRFMTVIQGVLPEARFIHLIRDGRDVACSVVPLSWGPESVTEAAARWREGIELARGAAPSLEGYTEVRYEDLVADADAVLRRVCAAVELPFHPAMLGYHERAGERLAEMERPLTDARGRLYSRAALFDLTRSPPNTQRIGRWRHELRSSERRAFEAIAGGLLADLGYLP